MAELDREFDYYQQNKDMFLSKYDGKVVVIVGNDVVGVYDSEREAVDETVKAKKYQLGEFLVQYVTDEDQTEFFHSRAYVKNG